MSGRVLPSGTNSLPVAVSTKRKYLTQSTTRQKNTNENPSETR